MANRPDSTLLSAALATPDDGVVPPTRAQPASAITQLAALKVGECWSKVERVPAGLSVEEAGEQFAALRDSLRNRVHSSLRHAKQKTGNEYTVETADIIGASGGIYIGAIVRRVS